MSLRLGILLTESGIDAAVTNGRAAILRRAQVATSIPPVLPDETELDALAEAIVQAATETDGLDLPAHLVVPSTWCFHQPIELASRFSAAAATFELEGHLPVPAEDLACAFTRYAARRWLGLAIRRELLARLLGRLAEDHVCVQQVTPDSTLIGCGGSNGNGQLNPTMLLADGHAVTHGPGSGNGGPVSIRSWLVPGNASPETEIDRLRPATEDQPNRWTVLDLRTVSADRLSASALDTDEWVDRDRSLDRLHGLASKHHGRLPNLYTGPLAPTHRRDRMFRLGAQTLILVTVLLLALAGDLYRQTAEHRRACEGLTERQSRVYREALPGSTVPTNPALRLASERIRLEGLTRRNITSGSTQRVSADRYAAIETLRCFVAELPADVRIMLLDWDLDRSHLSVRGRTANHRDAERITEAVNRIPGLRAAPPRTTRLDGGGVEFTIRAKRDLLPIAAKGGR